MIIEILKETSQRKQYAKLKDNKEGILIWIFQN